MKVHDGQIKYNAELRCYGVMGSDGNWIKEKLEGGARIDVVINGERFATNYDCEYDCPTLKPHAWDNWDFLCTLPAAYYEFEERTKQPPMPEQEEKRMRCRNALWCIVGSIATSAFLGAVFALFGLNGDTTYLKHFYEMSKGMFWLFGAGLVSGAVLLVANILPERYCFGFGCALYYGTILLSELLSNFIYGAEINRYIISFVIVSLACYVAWLKYFKKEHTD